MHEWKLKQGDPISLTVAADARLNPPDYVDDQIWELSLGCGDPPALALQSTYGLRAISVRIFPRFALGEEKLMDPDQFHIPPVINKIFPNFLSLKYSPFLGIDVYSEIWVPSSKGFIYRTKILNRSAKTQVLSLDWIGQLLPVNGERFACRKIQGTTILSGYSNGLAPVIFLTGGPKDGIGSYPSLLLAIELKKEETRSFTLAHAALSNPEESFIYARNLVLRKLDAEVIRIEMVNEGLLDIMTGDPDWDSAFMLSQKVAFGLITAPSPHLAWSSFVLSRNPDQGFSILGDGRDYYHLWNGQTPFDAYYLSGFLLPSSPEIIIGIFKNFLHFQNEDGFIDLKPGLAGQKSNLLATPILTSIAWEIYQYTSDKSFLQNCFISLYKFVNNWFASSHDRDEDGIPEWDHPIQTGFEDHPIFSQSHDWYPGVAINSAENPGLCALLYRECLLLVEIAKIIQADNVVDGLLEKTDKLKTFVNSTWDYEDSSYRDVDRDTHHSTSNMLIGNRIGPGFLIIQQRFDFPIRLLIHLIAPQKTASNITVFVHGMGISGKHRVERIDSDRFNWLINRGSLTGNSLYTYLEQIEFRGIGPDDQVYVYQAGYDGLDQSLMLPIWARLPDTGRTSQILEKNIQNRDRFWHPFGIPAFIGSDSLEQSPSSVIHMPWNALIGEGLVKYGFRDAAADLVNRLMKTIIQSLKQDHAFHRYYHSESGKGIGERNVLTGLAPIRLFLDTLGVRIFTPNSIFLEGFNPFPWPVTIKYRGLIVNRHTESTLITFPSGQSTEVTNPEPQLIKLDN